MAAPDFDDVSLFEETRISSLVTVDSALEFFQTYGIFYQADAEIGQIAAKLKGEKYSVHHINQFKPAIKKDPRLSSVLEPFLARTPSFCFPIGPDPGNFYSLTIDANQDHRATIYMWRPGSKIEFSHGSHTGPANGLTSSNGRIHRPYVNLSETRKLKDVPVNIEIGGV